MPVLNIQKLIDCLRKINNNLYMVYVDTVNISIADSLISEINFIDTLISQLETLI